MKKAITALFILLTSLLNAQSGYEIKVTLKPFKNQYVYLGHYYGKQLPIIDSIKLNDKSEGTFKGAKKLGNGIYLIGYPDRANKFEFLVGKEQKFSILADTLHINDIHFVGSPDNTSFKAYQLFMYTNGKAMDNLAFKQKGSAKKDSLAIAKKIDSLSKKIMAYRVDIMAKQPTGLLTALLKGMREPDVPANPEAQKKDSLYSYHYFKKHYWDGVDFWDDRMVRTPFFEGRLDKYYEQLVYPSSDSVIKELDWMLGYAQASEEMEKFLLLKFINRYLNQKYMWEDAVFVHLFEKYIAPKTYTWLTDKGRKVITDRAISANTVRRSRLP